MDELPGEVTLLLRQLDYGTPIDARLFPMLYGDLRRMARGMFRHEAAGHTLQPTALVHEAYMRLAQIHGIEWANREHFLAVAGKMMRLILVDHARAQDAAKRGGDAVHAPLDETYLAGPVQPREILALHDALKALSRLDERQSRIVELRFFSGLTDEETAKVLGISSRTVKRDWRVARAWLYRELACSGAPSFQAQG